MYDSVAVFTFAPETTGDQLATLAHELTEFAHRIEGLVGYATGADLRVREGNDDFAVVAVFETEESMLAYLNHPDHADIQARLVAPIVASKHSTQFRVTS